jgi:hypothetical protein
LAVAATSFWSSVLPAILNAEWQADVRRIAAEAEGRRKFADYDTGSISEYDGYLLRALAEFVKAEIVVDVGTFIGTSAYVLASAPTVGAVYTCDASNDCLPDFPNKIHTFPKTNSLDMFREMRMPRPTVVADLCFFDGVLRDEDIDLLAEVTTPAPVFAVHDYNYGPKIRKYGLETVPRKGIGNIRLLKRRWPTYAVVEPLPDTTVALFVPASLL